jgi:hypothetical protein
MLPPACQCHCLSVGRALPRVVACGRRAQEVGECPPAGEADGSMERADELAEQAGALIGTQFLGYADW